MRKLFLTVVALAVTNIAIADEAQVREAVTNLIPNAEITSIGDSAIPGLYQVLVNGQVLYISGDGTYLVQGKMFNIKTREDLTESAMSIVRVERMKEVSNDTKITYKADNPQYTVDVFTDIDCGYCRRLHQSMEVYNDLGITIRYLFYPRSGPNSHSFDKAVSVWCADDPNVALTDAKTGSEPDPLQCDNPVQNHYQLGRNVGLTGTPAIVTEDGSLLPGYVQPEKLLEYLQNAENAQDAG